ncbi:MAG TPA: DUF1269 domain-containing protein [Anaeromyxobacteraceae bacterium]|nr:DUF1269 domain-containing protein [Anaeromyxobacteraceae bacterium]
MERMLVVVFDSEKKAYEGSRVLRQLDKEGSIAVYAGAVLAKGADGKISVKQGDEGGPWGTLTGTAVGSLIGLLGGPVGFAIGAASGALLGAIPDLENARVGDDFLDDVAKALTPARVAVVAEIDEEWTAPVDAQMEALGGEIFRRGLSEVVEKQHEREIAAMKADIAQLKAEHAAAKAERKAKLQARIDTLNARLQQRGDMAKAQRQAIQREVAERVDALKKKVAAATREVRATQEKRLAVLEKQYRDFL